MSRIQQALQKNVTVPEAGTWIKTEGYLRSVEAALTPSGGTATVGIYVSNSSHGNGVKLAELTLSGPNASDGFSLPAEDQGWMFVRSDVTAVSAEVKSVTACIGE